MKLIGSFIALAGGLLLAGCETATPGGGAVAGAPTASAAAKTPAAARPPPKAPSHVFKADKAATHAAALQALAEMDFTLYGDNYGIGSLIAIRAPIGSNSFNMLTNVNSDYDRTPDMPTKGGPDLLSKIGAAPPPQHLSFNYVFRGSIGEMPDGSGTKVTVLIAELTYGDTDYPLVRPVLDTPLYDQFFDKLQKALKIPRQIMVAP